MTKGQLESLISNKMTALQREQLGRGAEGAKTYIIQDMVIVRLKNVLTPAEHQLAMTEDGKCLIKQMRYHLEDIVRDKMEELISSLTNKKVISVHNDISTKTGERIDVFVLDSDLEGTFSN